MPTADVQIRDQLKTAREQLADLRQRRAEAKKERDAAKTAFAEADFSKDGDPKITDSPEFKAAEEAVRRVGDLDDEIAAKKEEEDGLRGLLGDAPDPFASSNGNGPSPGVSSIVRGWDGHSLLANSEGYADARERGVFHSTGKFGVVELGEIATREQAVDVIRGRSLASVPNAPGNVTIGSPASPMIVPDYRGVISPLLLSLSLLDLIPSGTTDSNIVNYVQVTGIPGPALETAELAAKPQLGMTFADAQSPVVTIAGFIKAARQALDDMAGLATMINTLLPYAVRRRLLGQVIAGDGVGQNLLGIMNTAGIGAPAFEAGDTLPDAVLRAMTTVILSDADPNFVALNPMDWQTIMLLKNTQGNYIYGAPGQLPGGMPSQTLWGLNLTANRIMVAGQPLVGDAAQATIMVREGLNVVTSDSDQDDFIKNRVTILAEMRVALLVWRPSGFATAQTS